MGFDVHIAHTFAISDERRAPIRRDEVERLIAASADLDYAAYDDPQPPASPDVTDGFWWNPEGAAQSGVAPTLLRFVGGRISTKWPTDQAVARMVAMADDLNAWVVDDDGMHHFIDADGAPARREFPLSFRPYNVFRLCRPGGAELFDGDAEWLGFMADRDGFSVIEEIRLPLPSGNGMVPCPPTVAWTDADGTTVVPLYFADGEVTIENATDGLLERLRSLAAEIQASLECDLQRDPW
jgi:hypothetical protein